MEVCRLCPRNCGVNRINGQIGYCGCGSRITISRAALHFWEEPCISGLEGSGAIFFTGCNLGCVYCQNYEISRPGLKRGKEISVNQLVDIMLDLQKQGANNINLVTGFAFVPLIVKSIDAAKQKGLNIPVVYNSSGYESLETLKMLRGYVDIYLPDLKYLDPDRAHKYSKAVDYCDMAKRAIDEMFSQTGECSFYTDAKGQELMKTGVIVRHLLLPGAVRGAKAVVDYLYEHYEDKIFMSLMSQYTPFEDNLENYPELKRRVTAREYDRLIDYVLEKNIQNVFVQDRSVAKDSFVPEFF